MPDSHTPMATDEEADLMDAVGAIIDALWSGAAVPEVIAQLASESAEDPLAGAGVAVDPAERAWWAHLVFDVRNAVPWPENGLEAAPQPYPAAEEPCICGSGAPYNHCCGAYVGGLPGLTTAMLWPLVLPRLDRKTLEAGAADGRLPTEPVLGQALELRDEGRTGRAAALLEALFQRDPEALGPEAAPGVSILAEVLDAQGHNRKKDRWLAHWIAAGSPALAGAARVQRANQRLDMDDVAGARADLEAGRAAWPANPDLAVLELLVLVYEGDPEQARMRADVLRRQLVRSGEVDAEGDPRLGLLERAATDPVAAFAEQWEAQVVPEAAAVSDWLIEDVADRPFAPLTATNTAAGWVLEPAEPIQPFEEAWRELWAAFEAGLDAGGSPFPLFPANEPAADAPDWVAWLLEHPEAADSPEILLDLAEMLDVRGELPPQFARSSTAARLIERGAQGVWQALQNLDPPAPLVPDTATNEAALRLLVGAIGLRHGRLEAGEAVADLEALRPFWPTGDSELDRALVHALLNADRNDEARTQAKAFLQTHADAAEIAPRAELHYAEALAAFRLGEADAAANALHRAIEADSARARALLVPEAEAPATSQQIGGEMGDAYLYRQRMGAAWAATPGALDWLARHMG